MPPDMFSGKTLGAIPTLARFEKPNSQHRLLFREHFQRLQLQIMLKKLHCPQIPKTSWSWSCAELRFGQELKSIWSPVEVYENSR